MADGVGLENRYWETNRGFESHVLRQLVLFLRELAAQGEGTRRSAKKTGECGLCHFATRGACPPKGGDLAAGPVSWVYFYAPGSHK